MLTFDSDFKESKFVAKREEEINEFTKRKESTISSFIVFIMFFGYNETKILAKKVQSHEDVSKEKKFEMR